MELIVIPKVLGDLLREVDEGAARGLALDFAEQALRASAQVLGPALGEASLSYVDAARNLVEGGEASGIAHAQGRYFAARTEVDRVGRDASWVASVGVMASCQRELERAGLVARNAYRPTVLDVVREAQKVAGERADPGHHEPRAAKEARWQCAREQLILLLESVPFPD